MLRYILRRLLTFIPTILLISFLTFAVGFYGPGDPIRVLMREQWNDEETYQLLRHKYGFDRPFLVQYVDYIWKSAHGDFGRSVLRKLPVRDLMLPALAVTAQLGLVTLLMLAVVGVGLGILAAHWQNTWRDYAIVGTSIFLQSIPPFVLAPILMIILVLRLKWINTPSGWDGLSSPKVILPIFLLTILGMSGVVRQTREAFISVRNSDYVRTAHAKGLRSRTVLMRHVLLNALSPIFTTLGLLTGWLLTGSIFIESIFSIPGFGSLFYGALKTRDYPVLIGTTLVGSFIILTVNLIVDLSYPLLDPRVRVDR
jgi:ABC-type dipeptide/oligopeptide/nickel transport system permease component